MSIKMKATRRHYHLADRKEYLEGQTFMVGSAREADRLVQRHRAVRVTEAGANRTDLPAAASVDEELVGARKEYQEVVGTRPFHGWDAAILREKIGAYRTRHLTAEQQSGQNLEKQDGQTGATDQ